MRINRFHLLAALTIALIVGVVGAQANAARSSTAAGVVHDVLSTASANAATEVSTNWAGYAVSTDATTYTSVTGTWTEPTVTCGASDAGTSSAFWVGLGGLSTTSQALEQIGTSAEWIAEAPSQCTQFRCTPIPLANFNSVSFSKTAAIGNSIGGTITNPAWTTSSIQLVPGGSSGFFPGPNRFSSDASSTAGAAPGQVSADGKSFTVTWQPNATAG
jgi:Peptidase A4 family